MTAVASLTHVWVMVHHKLPAQLQRSKLKTSHWFFNQSVFLNPVTLHLLSKNILSKHFCS